MKKLIPLPSKIPDDFLLDFSQEEVEAIFQKAKDDYPDLSDFRISSTMYGGYDGDDRFLESSIYGAREETDAERQARETMEEKRRKWEEEESRRLKVIREERAAREEKTERETYERLKQKYGDK